MLHEKHKTRLEEEYEYWKGLSIDELTTIKLECHEARNIISFELEEAKFDDRLDTPWYRKAYSAYKIFGIKITTLDALISGKRENVKMYKNFHFMAKKILPEETYNEICAACGFAPDN